MTTTAVMTAVVPQRRVMSLQATAPPRASSLNAEARFGQYVLGQTLGEGEFGKVKLGWPYARNGTNDDAQVAIKLIRKESVGSSRSRIVKIEREINVLRRVKHPNIVKCHEVVETTKYIGIILEYASGSCCLNFLANDEANLGLGGELFDYILAHRYLRDPVASKLFAQLISAVQYLHLRGIVHRDLKLENLLLDRNRNIIITDFGFANTFDASASSDDAEAMKKRELISNGKVLGDLMQTSCGSPCYAAPELVVSDGYYCGRKVDVWSCGVILYAMLAGYLPFDDDPSNPEGDNISLLYKYIVSTPLTFPEYVTPLARDLLRHILVPDPRKRAFLGDIVSHQWLAPHSQIMSLASSADQSSTGSTDAKAGSQDMLRSTSERTSAHSSAALPAVSHLVPTGFAKNTSMNPSTSAGTTITSKANKRHTVQIEYEKPILNTVRPSKQDTHPSTADETIVAGLSIAAAPAMARSVTHTGTQSPRRNEETVVHSPASSKATARLPTPGGKPRPTSYHPSLPSSSEPQSSSMAYADPSLAVENPLAKTTIKQKRQSWSRGSISNSKTASPRSTRQNVTGEISGASSQDHAITLVRSNSVNARIVPVPITRTRRQHKRNSSSISIVFGKLWGSPQPDEGVFVDDEEATIGSNAMNAIAEHEAVDSSTGTLESQARSHSATNKNRYSLASLANRLNIMPYTSSDTASTKPDTGASRSSKDSAATEVRPDFQIKKKSAGQIAKGSDKVSTSAAKRVMDFFSGRRRYKAQEL